MILIILKAGGDISHFCIDPQRVVLRTAIYASLVTVYSFSIVHIDA